MTDSGNVRGRRYRIVVRGECGDLMARAFQELAMEPGRGTTLLTADVVDSSQLYGILDRLRYFAIELVSLNEIGEEAGSGAESSGSNSAAPMFLTRVNDLPG
jgi:hypothetical protein